ncbi:ribosomal protein S18-alanine N-acetyltransferase [Scatolibacter rhodanostii]|uniref:ribosomal protein S18-alanine N-acetyltransferase n=1 Tax=Scatolibacter rhodanostii TaxID=2014781 RepID=UPI000C086765|nr:ribosomal protein S18-alanine N-acetyltransferase [Scatolibacter rhodanostii]
MKIENSELGNMEIVKMTKDHTEALADLEKLCFSEPWSKKSLDDMVDHASAYFVTALHDGNILGYGGMHCSIDEFYIDNIAVYRRHRNKGVGSAIINNLADEAKRRGGKFISLEVRLSNKAVDLYKRLGFAEEGRRKNFYTQPREDALILTRRF